VREKEHIAMIRENHDGTKAPLTVPNHLTLKASTLPDNMHPEGIARKDFLKAYEA
jgi:hypothetical protein